MITTAVGRPAVAGQERPGPAVARRVIVGLVVAIAAADWIANSLVPTGAQLPAKLAIVAAFLAWARRGIGLSWSELGLDPARLRSGARWGAVVAAVVGVVVVLGVVLPGTASLLESGDVHHEPLPVLLATLVVIPIGTVVFEEVIFRGVLLGALLRGSSPPQAVVTSAVLFGLWHVPPALHAASGTGVGELVATVAGTIVVTTAAGIGFAVLRLRSGSLLAPVLAHVATNSFAYLGAVLSS